MINQVLLDIGKALFLVTVYILSTGLVGYIGTKWSDNFVEDIPWAMYATGCVLYIMTVLALWK